MLQNRGIYFHISWFFAYIRTADRQTGETYGTTGKGLDILHGLDQDFDVMEHPQSVIHILCTRESMNFRFQNINYNIVAGDYVILANMSLASGFSESDDYNAVTMGLSKQFVMSMERAPGKADGLKAAPVPRGNAGLPYDCTHPGSVRQVYRNVLQQGVHPAPGCPLLYLPSRLCVTLHYLSEICRKACGIPVTYWIDRFTLHEIANLLCQKELPLSEIAAGMNFSSFSYFSRYVSRHFGISHTMSTGSH